MSEILIQAKEGQIRLDKLIAEECPTLSRSHVQKLIMAGAVLVSGKPQKAGYILKPGEEIKVHIPEPEPLLVKPQEIELDIVYEDEDLLLVNKPQGMVVHPASGNEEGTLVNALLHHCQDSLSGINGVIRPGIVHRIDKDTSGLLLVAKNDLAHLSLAEQIKEHSANREYLALVSGRVKENGTVNAPIGRHPTDRKKMAVTHYHAREAITHYEVLEPFREYSLVHCRLETGRTHQIRVHLAFIGHPVVGDPVYGAKKQRFSVNGQLLHAFRLSFVHPRTGEALSFEVEPPDYFKKVLQTLRNMN